MTQCIQGIAGVFVAIVVPCGVQFKCDDLNAYATLYMKMWHVDYLNHSTKLAEISTKVYLYLKIQF